MFQIQRTERGGQPGQGVDPEGRAPQERSERPVRQDLALTEGGEPLEYLTFPLLERTGIVKHLFTTRLGGVSRGECATMNFSVDRDENRENVLENYRRIAGVLDCRVEDMVASHQTHTTNIRRMTSADKGKGILRPRDYADVDGMVTDEPGLVLNTFYADCVPLYFVDPVHRAVGLAHSGWRGTAGRMGARMVEAMGERFGSRPEEIYAAVGPSICRDCYEVSGDVAEQFIRMLGEAVPFPEGSRGSTSWISGWPMS